jgi:uncharacterized BrkB/YihY/UPF0761 family membrane protein
MPANLVPVAIASAILFGIYKFAPNAAIKAMALGAAGAIVAKQLPYVKDVA